MPIEIEAEGFGRLRLREARQLHHPDLNAVNTPDDPDQVKPVPLSGVQFEAEGLIPATLTPASRTRSVVCDGRKELPSGASREYSSYCDNYTYDGEKLVTRVDAASDPGRIGSDQVRGVRFEGERMVLIPPPRQHRSGCRRSPDSVGRRRGTNRVSVYPVPLSRRHRCAAPVRDQCQFVLCGPRSRGHRPLLVEAVIPSAAAVRGAWVQ
jgi:Lipocalin-like domain